MIIMLRLYNREILLVVNYLCLLQINYFYYSLYLLNYHGHHGHVKECFDVQEKLLLLIQQWVLSSTIINNLFLSNIINYINNFFCQIFIAS